MDDKKPNMILKTIKRSFLEALIDYYPEPEINSFFNLLSEHILGMKRIDIALNLYSVVSGKKHQRFNDALNGLQNYEPIQYIIGETEFFGIPYIVNQNVLIPRPETEELVSWIIEESNKNLPLKILDIGTGSGCIAISIAKHLPNAKLYALDVSDEVLKVAKENAIKNNVSIEFIETDILNIKSQAEEINQKFDIIVSNPPYVRVLEKAQMQDNVLNNEPHLALFVNDDDPLQFYKAISHFAVKHLKSEGLLFFEINEYLGEETKKLLINSEFEKVELKKDIFNKDRMLKATNKI